MGRCDSVSRRLLLVSIPALSLSGCVSDDTTPPAIRELEIKNTSQNSIDTNVSITQNDEAVHDRTYTLDGKENSEVDGTSVDGPWIGESGPTRVTIDVPTVGTETISTQEFVDQFGDDYDSVRFLVTISDTRIGIYHDMDG